MAPNNHTSITGNLTADPQLRFTPGGQPTVTFGVAVNRRWQNRQIQEWEESTSFFDVVAWDASPRTSPTASPKAPEPR
jgi:single-strand DNA-binding protein